MIDEANIYPDTCQRLYDMFCAKFQGTFKMFFLGALDRLPPDDMLPCLVVYKPDDLIDFDAAGLDASKETILVNVITNAKIDFNNPQNVYQNTTQRKLQNIIQARDATTGGWMVGTIMEAVRTNFTLDQSTLGSTVRVNYAVTPRKDEPTIVEALITLTVNTGAIPVPNRS